MLYLIKGVWKPKPYNRAFDKKSKYVVRE